MPRHTDVFFSPEVIPLFPYFVLFGRIIPMYAAMAMMGILISGWYLCRSAKRRGMDENDVIILGLIVCIGVFLGGHLLYALVNYNTLPEIFRQTSWKGLLEALRISFSGSVFYGGLGGGILAAVIDRRIRKKPLTPYADLLAPAAPLFHGFARIGCFLGGCCYGIPCSVGFIYTRSLFPEADGVRRFPVQLLEAAFDFALFLLLHRLSRREKWRGALLPLYLLLYSAFRFGDEFLRGDTVRGIWWGLSTSQWISIPLFLCAALLLFRWARRGRAAGDIHARTHTSP